MFEATQRLFTTLGTFFKMILSYFSTLLLKEKKENKKNNKKQKTKKKEEEECGKVEKKVCHRVKYCNFT